jgi:selenocysteine lyase/cysteine desulfurase
MPAIERRIRELTRHCMERLEAIGWPSITPREDARRGATVAVRSRDCVQLAAELMRRGIVTSHRDHNGRASFHFYNDDTDIDSLITALGELRQRFGPA